MSYAHETVATRSISGESTTNGSSPACFPEPRVGHRANSIDHRRMCVESHWEAVSLFNNICYAFPLLPMISIHRSISLVRTSIPSSINCVRGLFTFARRYSCHGSNTSLLTLNLVTPTLMHALHKSGGKSLVPCSTSRTRPFIASKIFWSLHLVSYRPLNEAKQKLPSPVHVELRSLGSIITMKIAYTRGQKINTCADEFLDILCVCQDSYRQLDYDEIAPMVSFIPARSPVSMIPSSPPSMRPVSASTAIPRSWQYPRSAFVLVRFSSFS